MITKSMRLSPGALILITALLLSIHAQAQQVKDRVLMPQSLPPGSRVPLAVSNLQVDDKDIAFGQKFAAGDEWVRGLTFDVKNVTNKVITHIYLVLRVTSPNGKIGLGPLFYFGVDPAHPEMKATVLLKPDEVVHVTYTDKMYKNFKGLLDFISLPSVTNAELVIESVLCADGEMYRNGSILRRDPNDPKRWLPISR
jgi:hypothetical protein